MSPENFIYWIRGFYELAGEGPLTAEQSKLISDHLKLVMQEVEKPKDWPKSLEIDTHPDWCGGSTGVRDKVDGKQPMNLGGVQKLLEAIDFSTIPKGWEKFCEATGKSLVEDFKTQKDCFYCGIVCTCTANPITTIKYGQKSPKIC